MLLSILAATLILACVAGYVIKGILVWQEWRYTFPAMLWSRSKWKWLWMPTYKTAEFLFLVFLWPLAFLVLLIGLLLSI